MEQLRIYFSKHAIVARAGAAIIYGILVGIAMNFFWKEGNIYSSGFNGLSQLVGYFFPVSFLPWIILIVNIPMTALAWIMINHRLAFFELFAIACSSFFIAWIVQPAKPLATDPLMCALFGGVLNGFATGFALRNGVATGGLDVFEILGKRIWNIKVFPINVSFNLLVMLGSGFQHGWRYALYSIIGIVVSAWITSIVYAQQQQVQAMIVTNDKDKMAQAIQDHLRRGVTLLDDAKGAYLHDSKQVIFVVITLEERYTLSQVIKKTDPKAFASFWKVDHTIGNFYEKEV
ncbi:YitT family protein [Oenococcus alcoholitolerans]|uniref:YitT family protein n=1 Tax=Oenococcus alcoholitolerans TaxID=931074 RepID=UPI003F72F550